MVGCHEVLLSVGSAAPIAAFMTTKRGGRTGPAPRSGRSEAEDGGGRIFCFPMQIAPSLYE
jgi:hypothetical protein